MPTTYGNDIVYASSHIVGYGDIVGRSGGFKFKLSANSVMRGRVKAGSINYRRKVFVCWPVYVLPNFATNFELKAGSINYHRT